ncbi:molybdate ABC transporter permease subunit [Brevundimonas sp. UBA2416]|jgi:molybdate transport system permease protein|uniref:molybdate ABC transporter permease subunit n=1 Tax=Brevundimonas sp. UBA2416 TaxID=1946124 RepID=UPI0025C1C728|nr:molybdate ABC transporter permease subunit [Brevundimonas sp. UBA2416]HRJ62885.1 molybdate ABC transporter permease subunit [Brevundimonas sp.]
MFTLSPEEQQIIGLSLKVAATATLFSLPPGVALAYLLSRYSFPGKALLSGLTHLPLILPPVVTGYALLLLFGRSGPLGRLLEPMGIVFAFDWTGAALAAAVMGFPLLVRAVRLSFDMVDPRIESAAGTLGAGPIVRFLTITLPLALPGVAAGTVLAFAKALGEFGATITFVASIPGETRTLPLAIYSLTQLPDGEAALLRLILISVGVSIGALVLSEWGARSVARRVGGVR